MVDHRPEYISDLKSLIKRGQVELLGGAFFEPILAGIPTRDRIGQIRSFSKYLTQVFETPVRGMWMPERVWEQSFVSDLSEAGIEYTVLDDYHFQSLLFDSNQLQGYYLTEDNGKLLRIFPNNEQLRYMIPFEEPSKIIQQLRIMAEELHNPVVVFGDDGEKFGSWPETHYHVYERGWLKNFFSMISECDDWIKPVKLGEVIDSDAATDTCYLPNSSYREMSEWVNADPAAAGIGKSTRCALARL